MVLTKVHCYEKFEDTKCVIRNIEYKKDRQHNEQKKREKTTDNDL